MSKQQALIKYMQQVKNLEALKYTQDLLIDNLTRKTRLLAREKAIKESREKAYGFFEEHPWVAYTASIIALIITTYFMYEPKWISLASEYIAPSGNYYFGKNSGDRMVEAFLKSAGVGLCVGFGVFLLLKFVELVGKNRRQHQLDEEYSSRVAVATNKEQNRLSHELEVKKNILGQIESIKKERARTENALTQLYNLNILADKYHDLVPVSMICEYLELGRCYELQGHEGAYNIYENERRLNIIITQLEDIRSKLDEIRENQYALYEIMSQANNTLARIERTNNKILSTTQTIKRNSELIEFNTRAAATAARATGEFIIFKELTK